MTHMVNEENEEFLEFIKEVREIKPMHKFASMLNVNLLKSGSLPVPEMIDSKISVSSNMKNPGSENERIFTVPSDKGLFVVQEDFDEEVVSPVPRRSL